MLTNISTEPKYRKINHIQGIKRIIYKVFQIVPCVTVNLYISWKFYENLPIHFTVMLLTGTLRGLDERPWNSLGRCETVQIIILYVIHDILWKFFHPFFITSLTNTDPGNKKNRPCIQGVNRIIPKLFEIVPCLMSDLLWKMWQFHLNMNIEGRLWHQDVIHEWCYQCQKLFSGIICNDLFWCQI